MLKALMGFPSQSLLPDLKPQLLSECFCFHARWFQILELLDEEQKNKKPWLRSLVP
jgi:hypothetical protein